VTPTQLSRSKGQLAGAGHIVAASRRACYILNPQYGIMPVPLGRLHALMVIMGPIDENRIDTIGLVYCCLTVLSAQEGYIML